jgi:hypothetical protein
MKQHNRPTAPMSYDERERGFFQFFIQFDNYSGPPYALLGGRRVDLAELGLGLMAHEDGVNCTAQHVPEGSLLIYTPGVTASTGDSRPKISTVDVAPSIMRFFGMEAPAHMVGNPTILAV